MNSETSKLGDYEFMTLFSNLKMEILLIFAIVDCSLISEF